MTKNCRETVTSRQNLSDMKPSNKGNKGERPEKLKQKNSLNELNAGTHQINSKKDKLDCYKTEP